MLFASALDDPYDCVLGLDIGGIADVDLREALGDLRYVVPLARSTGPISKSALGTPAREDSFRPRNCVCWRNPSKECFMPFDGSSGYNSWENPWRSLCCSCMRPIVASEQMQTINVGYDPAHQVHQVNGAYHAACARPYLSLLKAFEAATGASR